MTKNICRAIAKVVGLLFFFLVWAGSTSAQSADFSLHRIGDDVWAAIVTDAGYDAVHRLTGKAYTALTCPLTSPPVNFLYDQTSYNGLTITNGIGRRTGMSDGSGTAAWSFDPMGRAAAEKRTLNSNVTKTLTFYYYPDGEMQQTIWPSNHQVTYTPSAAGRAVSALGTTYNFVSTATYAPQGAITSAVFGISAQFNGITVADTYNKRLQPSAITASLPTNALVQSLTYNFNLGTADNGNVYAITNGKDATRSQTFTYDNLNRIKTAATQGTTGSHCWGQMFGHMNGSTFVPGIDPWGNLFEITNTQTGCASGTLSQGISTKNQFIAPMVYDSAGNLTNDGGGHGFNYDTENRLNSAGGMSYIYDGDGKRVEKCTAGSTAGTCSANPTGTLYWTGPGWDPLLETDLAGNATAEYVFFNGERVARVDLPNNYPRYYFSDHLNSTDIVTNTTGGIIRESDYVPYGGEVVISGSDPNHYKFTGKERDPESGLDDFDARFYSSPFGRFMTPDWEAKPTDVPYANFGNPQSLNLYSYVQNNPTTVGDPDGHADPATALAEEAVEVIAPEAAEAVPVLALTAGLTQAATKPIEWYYEHKRDVVFKQIADENKPKLAQQQKQSSKQDNNNAEEKKTDAEKAKLREPKPEKTHRRERKSTWEKHTDPRPGRDTTKDRQSDKWRSFKRSTKKKRSK